MSSYAKLKTKKLADELFLTATAKQPGTQSTLFSQPEPSTDALLATLQCWGRTLDGLIAQGLTVSDWVESWSAIEDQPTAYFLQTLPKRLLAACLSPSRPFLSSLFPSIGTSHSNLQPHFLSTLSPVFFIKHEARLKRKELESIRTHLAQNIGTLIEAVHQIESRLRRPPPWDLAPSFSALVARMDSLMPFERPGATASLAQPSIDFSLIRSKIESIPKLQTFRSTTLADHLAPPGLLTRTWPLLFSLPLATVTLAKLVYTYRFPILDAVISARDTFRGFISGWVIKPVEDIFKTLKAGERGTLAIMSEESLSAELASLERMMLDFGRERFGWDDQRARMVAASVREGDLTEVLKVWENEIRTPIRSALAGSLVRILLIQLQKVKVDLAIAMEGIQSILRSQSLTFGAIGVAPSMLICFLLGKLLSALVRHRLSVVEKSTKAVRRDVRQSIRQMEKSILLISSASEHKPDPETALGLLFLNLHRLRAFAYSPHFPSHHHSCKAEYLEDLTGLEDLGVDWTIKRKLLKRFVARWGSLVGL